MPRWLERVLSVQWTPLRLAALAFAVFSLALVQGYIADDHMHQWMMRAADQGGPDAPRWWLDMFRFVDEQTAYTDPIEQYGQLPWWAQPGIKLAFLRPVSAATHRFDHLVAPGQAWFAHAHSLLWMSLCVALVARTYKAIGFAGPALALAGLFFAVDNAHAFATTWIANRSTWVAMALALLAFELHRRAREAGRPVGVLALVPLGVALLAKESAIVALVWIGAWELHLRDDALPRKLLALVLPTLLIAAWRWQYTQLDFGVRGSGMYIDPGGDPLRFAMAVGEKAPEMLMAQVVPIPIEMAPADPNLRVAIFVLAIFSCAALAWWMRPHWQRSAQVRFCVTVALLALIPASAPPVSSRLIVFAGFGALAAFANAIAHEFEQVRSGARNKAGRMTRFVLFAALPLSMLISPVSPKLVAIFGNTLYDSLGEHAEARAECQGADLLVVNGSDLTVAGTAIYIDRWAQRALDDPSLTPPRSVAALGPMMDASVVTRRDPRTLDIAVERGWFRSEIDRLVVQPETAPKVGERRPSFRFHANVVRSLPDGRPSLVRFEFDQTLDDPSYCWIANVDGRPTAFVPPEIGESVELRASPPRP